MKKKKTEANAKNFVRLRQKLLANGNRSLYLDIYRDGVRSYEFLKMHLIPVKKGDALAKEQNANTLQAAEVIRAERQKSIINGQAGITDNNARNKLLLVDWLSVYRAKLETRKYKKISHVDNLMRLLLLYKPASAIRLISIDKEFAKGFIKFLSDEYVSGKGNKRLQRNTIVDYVRTFSVAINAAIKDGYKLINPFKLLSADEKVRAQESHREHLTQDELTKMIETPCKNEHVKRAYLFACFCGLRVSDVVALRWQNITEDNGQCVARLVMQKTGKELYLPLSRKAVEVMPEKGSETDYVFNLPSMPAVEANLKKWAEDAGVCKHLTFHTARHTFATLMLTLGADLYTTSKLLGHTNIATTQIYAKIVDKKKVDAVNLVNDVFNK